MRVNTARYFLLGISDPILRQQIKSMLEKVGATKIVETGEGNKIIELLHNAEHYTNRFVIMDWDLYDMPGIDLVREIRCDKRVENVPIMLLASEASKEHMLLARDVGVSGCLVRPFEYVMLSEKLADITRRRADPPKHVRLIIKGEKLFKEEKYDEALAMFLEAQKIKNYDRVLINIGESYEQMGDFNDALESYIEAFEINPQSLRACVMAANLSIKVNDMKSALLYMEQAAKLSPHATDRLISLGAVYLINGEEEKAKDIFKKAIKKDPSKTRDIAEEYLKTGHHKMAELFFRRILDATQEVHIYNRLGITLRKQGKWKEAIVEYEKALEKNQYDEALFYNMGKSYLEGGLPNEAAKCFKQALAIKPQFNEAIEALKSLKQEMT